MFVLNNSVFNLERLDTFKESMGIKEEDEIQIINIRLFTSMTVIHLSYQKDWPIVGVFNVIGKPGSNKRIVKGDGVERQISNKMITYSLMNEISDDNIEFNILIQKQTD